MAELLSDGRRVVRKRARSVASHIFSYLAYKRITGFRERDETEAQKRLHLRPPAKKRRIPT